VQSISPTNPTDYSVWRRRSRKLP